MADIFEFMLGKKDKNKNDIRDNEEKQNFAFLMPMEVYNGEEETNNDFPAYDPPYNEFKSNYTKEQLPYYELEKLNEQEQVVALKRSALEFEDKIKTLNKKITDLHNKNNELMLDKSKYEYASSKYRLLLEKIIKIMPYFLEIEFTGIGTPETWSDRELVEKFNKCCQDVLIKNESYKKEIDTLKIKISEMASSPNVTASPDDAFEILDTIDVSELTGPTEDMEIDFQDEITSDTPSVDINPFEDENLHIYKSKLDDLQMKVIFETIGQTGLARVVDLSEIPEFFNTFKTDAGELNRGFLSKKLNELVGLELLTKTSINSGRKGGQEHLYALSDLGKKVYKSMFSSEPNESEMDIIKRQHTSLEHGYFIKAVAKELENKNYEVFSSPEECVRKPLIPDSNGDSNFRVEADLIAKNDSEELIIECEMGTTSQSDMNKKLDKLILVTTNIHFIMNNGESLSSTSSKVDRWISKKGKDSLKGFTFKFTTLDNLKRRPGCQWQNKSF